MPYQASLHYDLPIWDETASGRELREIRQGSLENPYRDYLALLRHLSDLASSAPVVELKRFADCGELRIENPGSPWSRYSLLLQWNTCSSLDAMRPSGTKFMSEEILQTLTSFPEILRKILA